MSTTTAVPRHPAGTVPPTGATPPISLPPLSSSFGNGSGGMVPAPTAAFQGVCWAAFMIGSITYLYSVWYTHSATVSDRYFLYTAYLFSLFGCMSVSKVVRDRQEKVPVTGLYYGLSYVAAIVPLVIVAYNLSFDAQYIDVSQRALIGMAYAISAFAVLAISKNERDKSYAKSHR